jgi:sulfite reductase (NADPH) flavoprotein alpha-component
MSWKAIHRWLGLTAGHPGLVLGITAPCWRSIRCSRPGRPRRTRRSVGGHAGGARDTHRARARGNPPPALGRHRGVQLCWRPGPGVVCGPGRWPGAGAWQASALPRWVKNLHRSLLLGDAGRWGAAGIALAMALLCVSGLVLLLRRMGGWRQLAARVRGSLAQRTPRARGPGGAGGAVPDIAHGADHERLDPGAGGAGCRDRTRCGLRDHRPSPPLPGAQPAHAAKPGGAGLRKLNFPDAADPQDTWKVATAQGKAGSTATRGRRWPGKDSHPGAAVYDWALVLHTGEAPGPGPWCSGWWVPACCCSGCRAWSSGGRHAARRRTSRATAPWHRPTC